MREGVITGTIDDASLVLDVHGSAGVSKWKCLARRSGLKGAWEAVEWAWLPPGGESGVHLHTRTEEVYLIVQGRGELSINKRKFPVEKGHLILNGLGMCHGLKNTGDTGLGWLVVEVLSPKTHDILSAGYSAKGGSSVMRNEEEIDLAMLISDLQEVGSVSPDNVFEGPLEKIELIKLNNSNSRYLQADNKEYSVFILGGEGTAKTSTGMDMVLKFGCSITLPLNAAINITAGPNGLEFVLVTMRVQSEGVS